MIENKNSSNEEQNSVANEVADHPYHAHVRSCQHCSGPEGHCTEGLRLKRSPLPAQDKGAPERIWIQQETDGHIRPKWLPKPSERRCGLAHVNIEYVRADSCVSTVDSDSRADEVGLNLLRQLVGGKNALRDLDVFACNSGEHQEGCECFWEQCERWAATAVDIGSCAPAQGLLLSRPAEIAEVIRQEIFRQCAHCRNGIGFDPEGRAHYAYQHHLHEGLSHVGIVGCLASKELRDLLADLVSTLADSRASVSSARYCTNEDCACHGIALNLLTKMFANHASTVSPDDQDQNSGKAESESSTSPEKEAMWRFHVPVTNEQHDVVNGLISGFCERCRVPWSCPYSPEAVDTSPENQNRHHFAPVGDSPYCAYQRGVNDDAVCGEVETASSHLSPEKNESIESALVGMQETDETKGVRIITTRYVGGAISFSCQKFYRDVDEWRQLSNAATLTEAVRQYHASLSAPPNDDKGGDGG